ncbi:MAG: TauD/TfdA family dioxygenase [Alphaproteobacteria bacterium]|nr:TauD/TfdA family dioxygenase [Alphaproteobacteria bacterium]
MGNISNIYRVEKLAPAIGAEIHGVDLAQGVDDALFGRIHDALMEHQVIFFRDQTIDIDQHVDLAKRFGKPLYSKKLKMYSEKYDCLSLLENDGSKIAVGSVWHTDNTDFEEPPMGSLLYCEVAPSVGGDTLWASMYAAYDALSKSTQEFLEKLTALHDNSNVRRRYSGKDVIPMSGTNVEAPSEHPVVHRHPVTGRKALFVNSNYTQRIVGVSDIESRHILQMLYEHCQRPEFQVRFRWRAGSLAIWDNRCTQHHALDDYKELRRMRRVQIAGSRIVL